ncbi:MAG: type II toxin-antitoxin system RelE/ParE family toxin [Ilumatobacteraceae bacterium]
MENVRTIIYYRNFFYEFYNRQSEKVKAKIDYVLFVLTVAERIPKQYFRHVTDTRGLYEIRVEYQGNIFRIFCCFDEEKIVVLLNGFQKKSQKTPKNEMEKAIRIMNDYFEENLPTR